MAVSAAEGAKPLAQRVTGTKRTIEERESGTVTRSAPGSGGPAGSSAGVDDWPVVVSDAGIGSDDRRLRGTSLRDEQPVKWVTMVLREARHRQAMIGIEGEDLNAAASTGAGSLDRYGRRAEPQVLRARLEPR